MADRSVKVVLNAQVQGYVDGMNKASQATKQVSAEGEKLSASSPNMQALGGALLGVGTAVSAIGIAAYKTGIEYNTMQQTTRAALTTLLGSAEAANAQMDKLDEFARSSPFAKTTFIQAQQQMLAFGIETQKVIPYLDAVQDAVAAAGGSNAEITGIVATMAKIQSSSKITAQDLIEFGNRGVNAAELIGSQMGKTGAQIREEISNGSLGATEALDALTKGMSERFGGASDNVKQTFAGAMDRVKAAWRDFSSELAKPLVDPNGGGALIDLLNWAADMMRGFEDLPEPVKNATTNIVLLGGAVALVTGAAILGIPKIAEYKLAMETLHSSSGKAAGVLSSVGRALGGIALAATAVSIMSAFATKASESTEAVQKLRDATSAKDLFLQAGENVATVGDRSVIAGEQVEDLAGKLDRASKADFFDSFNLIGDATLNNVQRIGETIATLAKTDLKGAQEQFRRFADETTYTKEQQIQLLKEMPALRDYLIEQANAAGMATDDNTLLALAFGEGSAASEQQAKALQETSGAAEDASGEIARLEEIIRNFGSATLDAREAEREFQQAVDDAAAALAENGATVDINTEAGRRNQEALDAMARAANDSAAASYLLTGDQAALEAQLNTAREQVYNQAIAFGYSEGEARKFADSAVASKTAIENIPTSRTTTMYFDDAVATQRAIAFRNLLYGIPGIVQPRGPLIGGYVYADGGIQSYADGGIQSFAGGGFPTGIYAAGTPIHKFAEPETRWEAYISGKQGQEARNRQIWVEAGRRLGMGGGSSGPVQVSLAGATLRASIDGRPISLMIHDQVTSALTAADTQNAVMV